MKILGLKSLAEFLAAADDTTHKIAVGSTPGLRLVREVDDLIRDGVWGSDVQLDPIPALLALNSYYTFLAGVRVALSGQAMAIFPLIRHGLECACYAYAIAGDARLADIWLHRHDGPERMKACRAEFGQAVSSVAKAIKARQEQLGALVDDLYQASIDFGAHPNAKSILFSLSIVEGDESTAVNLACLYSEADIALQRGLVACAEAGIVSAFVTALAAKDHPLLDEQYTAVEAIYRRVHATIEELQNRT